MVTCSCQEKDVVVDCLLWLLRSQWRVQISSCHSYTSSSSRNYTTTTHASSTSCYDVKRNKNQQCCNPFFCKYYAHLFMREGLLCDVLLHIAGLNSVFRNALQNATQLSFVRIPLLTKYFVMRECDNILHGYLYVVTTVLSHQDEIYGFKFPNRFLEVSCSCRDLTSFI